MIPYVIIDITKPQRFNSTLSCTVCSSFLVQERATSTVVFRDTKNTNVYVFFGVCLFHILHSHRLRDLKAVRDLGLELKEFFIDQGLSPNNPLDINVYVESLIFSPVMQS